MVMGMDKYLNKEMFLRYMGLVGDETKYGNRDAEHSNRSYSSWMGYEIMDSVEESVVEEDVVPVVRCKDCHNCTKSRWCNLLMMDIEDEWYCSHGKRRANET